MLFYWCTTRYMFYWCTNSLYAVLLVHKLVLYCSTGAQTRYMLFYWCTTRYMLFYWCTNSLYVVLLVHKLVICCSTGAQTRYMLFYWCTNSLYAVLLVHKLVICCSTGAQLVLFGSDTISRNCVVFRMPMQCQYRINGCECWNFAISASPDKNHIGLFLLCYLIRIIILLFIHNTTSLITKLACC